ncbi:MAG: hypothetical protein ACPL1D_00510 [Microgenomates group bacterium]
MKNFNISFWLIPEEKEKNYFQKIINDIAKKYKAFPFLPHITIYAGVNCFENELKKIISQTDQISNQLTSITLKSVNIQYSDIFTKTLYIQFKKTKKLVNYYSLFFQSFKNYFEYQLNPHLSLIYKNNMEIKEKEKLVKEILVPKQVIFNQLMIIVKENGSIKNEEDVLDWRIVYKKLL